MQKSKTRPMTNREKMNRRYSELLLAAKRDGFAKASEAITAWKNGEYILVKVANKQSSPKGSK